MARLCTLFGGSDNLKGVFSSGDEHAVSPVWVADRHHHRQCSNQCPSRGRVNFNDTYDMSIYMMMS